MTALTLIYTTTDEVGAAALCCQEHPDWYFDADGTNLPDVIKAAVEHLNDDHREHVTGCLCNGPQVLDTRCRPRLNLAALHR